jgi:hypothetical protein
MEAKGGPSTSASARATTTRPTETPTASRSSTRGEDDAPRRVLRVVATNASTVHPEPAPAKGRAHDPGVLLTLAFLAGGFLLGSIPFALLIGLARGTDIRTVGSRNPGATNLGRHLGFRWFAVCFVLDAAKGLAPTLAFGFARGFASSSALTPPTPCSGSPS